MFKGYHIKIKCFPYVFLFSTESKESVREKRARKRASSAVEFNGNQEPKQDLDASDAEATPDVPNGFLSASVREYLELGRSIPGWYTFNSIYLINISKTIK